jgi:hypothetical protein
MTATETLSSTSTFSAWFDAETTGPSHPDTGAIEIEPNRLRFENDSANATLSLSTIRDIRVDYVPDELGPFPPGRVPVTVVYRDDNDITAATIAAGGEVIRPFTTELLETLLSGASMRVRHPVKIDQEPTPSSFRQGTLALVDGTLRFNTGNDESVHTSNVISFEQVEQDSMSERPIRITASRGNIQYETDIQLPNSRITAILGRYLSIQTRLNLS